MPVLASTYNRVKTERDDYRRDLEHKKEIVTELKEMVTKLEEDLRDERDKLGNAKDNQYAAEQKVRALQKLVYERESAEGVRLEETRQLKQKLCEQRHQRHLLEDANLFLAKRINDRDAKLRLARTVQLQKEEVIVDLQRRLDALEKRLTASTANEEALQRQLLDAARQLRDEQNTVTSERALRQKTEAKADTFRLTYDQQSKRHAEDIAQLNDQLDSVRKQLTDTEAKAPHKQDKPVVPWPVSTIHRDMSRQKVHIPGIRSATVEKLLFLDTNSVGSTHLSIFGEALQSKPTAMTIQDKYLYTANQVESFREYVRAVATNAPSVVCIRVFTSQWSSALWDIAAEYKKTHGITIEIKIREQLHDRFVAFDNGFLVLIGRGFDIFSQVPTAGKPGVCRDGYVCVRHLHA